MRKSEEFSTPGTQACNTSQLGGIHFLSSFLWSAGGYHTFHQAIHMAPVWVGKNNLPLNCAAQRHGCSEIKALWRDSYANFLARCLYVDPKPRSGCFPVTLAALSGVKVQHSCGLVPDSVEVGKLVELRCMVTITPLPSLSVKIHNMLCSVHPL